MYYNIYRANSELFNITLGQDRATKIAEFIGNQIVNEAHGHKPELDPIHIPTFGQSRNGSWCKRYFFKVRSKRNIRKINE